jgi:hypothetical protein
LNEKHLTLKAPLRVFFLNVLLNQLPIGFNTFFLNLCCFTFFELLAVFEVEVELVLTVDAAFSVFSVFSTVAIVLVSFTSSGFGEVLITILGAVIFGRSILMVPVFMEASL